MVSFGPAWRKSAKMRKFQIIHIRGFTKNFSAFDFEKLFRFDQSLAKISKFYKTTLNWEIIPENFLALPVAFEFSIQRLNEIFVRNNTYS